MKNSKNSKHSFTTFQKEALQAIEKGGVNFGKLSSF